MQELPPAERLALAEAALREPFIELQSAAFSALVDPDGLNRPDLIIQHYTDLLPDIRQRVAAQGAVFEDAAKEEILSGSEWSRRAGYEVVAGVRQMEALPTLARGVNDSSTVVRESVADALERLGQRYYYHLVASRMHGDPASQAFIREHQPVVLQTLGELLRSFPVHGKRVFIDLAIESDPETYAMITDIVLARRDLPTFHAFVQSLSTLVTQGAVELLFKLYLEPRLRFREVAVEIMKMRHDAPFASLVATTLGRMSPERLESFASRVRDVPWWGAVEAAPDLDPFSSTKVLEFLAKSGLEPGPRDAKVLHFHISPYPEVRIKVLSTLEALHYPSIVELAAGFLSDPSDEVKIAAARTIAALNPPEKARLLVPFLTSSNADLRAIASKEASQASFDRYVRSFDRLDPKTREVAARALAKIDERIVERLSEEITSLDPDRRLKALKIVDYVDAETDLRETLMDLLRDPDRRVRATAIKIVQLTESAEGMRHLVGALSDPDARVRANAIEAFEDNGDARLAPLLVPFLSDADNRARANAAKALIRLDHPEGIATLEAMLEDPHEMMRLSAVWALGELRIEGTVERLLSRSRDEKSTKVRAKITETLVKMAEPAKGEGTPSPAGR